MEDGGGHVEVVVLQHTGGVERGQRSVVLLHEVVVVTTVVQVVTQAGDKQANSLGRGGEGRGSGGEREGERYVTLCRGDRNVHPL